MSRGKASLPDRNGRLHCRTFPAVCPAFHDFSARPSSGRGSPTCAGFKSRRQHEAPRMRQVISHQAINQRRYPGGRSISQVRVRDRRAPGPWRRRGTHPAAPPPGRPPDASPVRPATPSSSSPRTPPVAGARTVSWSSGCVRCRCHDHAKQEFQPVQNGVCIPQNREHDLFH